MTFHKSQYANFWKLPAGPITSVEININQQNSKVICCFWWARLCAYAGKRPKAFKAAPWPHFHNQLGGYAMLCTYSVATWQKTAMWNLPDFYLTLLQSRHPGSLYQGGTRALWHMPGQPNETSQNIPKTTTNCKLHKRGSPTLCHLRSINIGFSKVVTLALLECYSSSSSTNSRTSSSSASK